jgi:hypothetical protein
MYCYANFYQSRIFKDHCWHHRNSVHKAMGSTDESYTDAELVRLDRTTQFLFKKLLDVRIITQEWVENKGWKEDTKWRDQYTHVMVGVFTLVGFREHGTLETVLADKVFALQVIEYTRPDTAFRKKLVEISLILASIFRIVDDLRGINESRAPQRLGQTEHREFMRYETKMPCWEEMWGITPEDVIEGVLNTVTEIRSALDYMNGAYKTYQQYDYWLIPAGYKDDDADEETRTFIRYQDWSQFEEVMDEKNASLLKLLDSFKDRDYVACLRQHLSASAKKRVEEKELADTKTESDTEYSACEESGGEEGEKLTAREIMLLADEEREKISASDREKLAAEALAKLSPPERERFEAGRSEKFAKLMAFFHENQRARADSEKRAVAESRENTPLQKRLKTAVEARGTGGA